MTPISSRVGNVIGFDKRTIDNVCLVTRYADRVVANRMFRSELPFQFSSFGIEDEQTIRLGAELRELVARADAMRVVENRAEQQPVAVRQEPPVRLGLIVRRRSFEFAKHLAGKKIDPEATVSVL